MAKADILCVHPCELTYPIWEHMMNKWRDYYVQLIICFTEGIVTGMDMRNKVKENLPFATFVEYPGNAQGDWRNIATNLGMEQVKADYVLFLEQDFILTDKDILLREGDVLGFKDDMRIHPAFLKVRKSLVDQTSKDFTAYPDEGMDHFGKFIKELERLTSDFTFLGKEYYYHMAGLTQNYRLENQGEVANYKPQEFEIYKKIAKLLE